MKESKVNEKRKKKALPSFSDVASPESKGIANYFNGFKEIQMEKEEMMNGLANREKEKLELMIEDNKRLERLLKNSDKAIEQRNTLIHNMYQMINESDASDKVKNNNILQIISLVNTLSDGKENLIKILGLKGRL